VNDHETPPRTGVDDREPLTPVAKGVAYKAVFAAIADGRNRVASLVLRDLTAEQLAELIIICADVRTMAEAAQRHREAKEGAEWDEAGESPAHISYGGIHG